MDPLVHERQRNTWTLTQVALAESHKSALNQKAVTSILLSGRGQQSLGKGE